MCNIDALQNFHAGSTVHALMVSVVILLAVLMAFRRKRRLFESSEPRSRTDTWFAAILYGIWLIAFLRDLRPDRIGWSHSLPLHICDVTGLMAAVAIQTGNRMARGILHFWGLVLSSQAFFFPVLRAGPIHSDFWIYWLDHSAIVLAAMYDITVRGYRPAWSDWRQATLLLGAYAMLIAPLDRLLGVDYGYLGQTDHPQRAAVEAFGPWPNRVGALWLTAIAGMALLKIRWRAIGTAICKTSELPAMTSPILQSRC
jgi:hypothetical integral membrane protein (TIGR02206 family)